MSILRIDRNCFSIGIRGCGTCTKSFWNKLLDYYLKTSCSILVTTQIALSDFRGHVDYQISVMLSNESGTKSGSKHSVTSG